MVIEQPDVTTERQVGSLMVQEADAFLIDSKETYLAGGEALLTVARNKRLVEAKIQPLCDATNRAHKQATALRGELLAPFEQAEKLYGRKMWDFEQEAKRVAREAQEKLEREAREQAARDQEARANVLDASGHTEEAVAELERETPAQAVQLPPALPKINGYSSREEFDFEILDVDQIKREFMVPDHSAIRAMVKKMGTRAAGIVGGIRIVTVARQTKRRT
jgi:hypothetical protein